jgi:hypothetical protein
VLEAPERVERAQLCRGVSHVLVHWTGLPTVATWEPIEDFRVV